MRIKYRAANGYDEKKASDEAVLPQHLVDLPSLTVQAHAADADINNLMRQYGITGKMPDNVRIPTYGDFTEITDFRSALAAVEKAHEHFMEVPAELRARFDNDPQKFLEYCTQEANRPEMLKLGLLKAPQIQPQAETPPVAPGAPSKPA